MVFCSHAAISLQFFFYCFFDFLDRIFFLNGFPNPFVVHSRPIFFVWTKFPFLANGFLFTCGIFALIFSFFIYFFRNGFISSLIVRSRSSFLFSHWKFCELFVSTCPAMFLFRRRDFCYDRMTSQPLQICFLFIRSCNFNWVSAWRHFSLLVERVFLFIRVIKFSVTFDLPHSQNYFLSSILTFVYFNSKR